MLHTLAYLDPATGSTAFQIAVAGVLSLLASLRIYWSRVRSLFAKFRKKEQPDAPQ
jgi:hypothetical protein